MNIRELHPDDEAHRLYQLLDACHRVLAQVADRGDDDIARAIRETCDLVEKRLADLGAPYMDTG